MKYLLASIGAFTGAMIDSSLAFSASNVPSTSILSTQSWSSSIHTRPSLSSTSRHSNHRSLFQLKSTTDTIEEEVTILPDDRTEIEIIDGVVCARGLCVIAEDDAPEFCYIDYGEDGEDYSITCQPNPSEDKVVPSFTFAFLWPRVLLLVCSVLYGINFPVGRLMNESLPASAATSTRMLLASIALSPFLFQLKPQLRGTAVICGSFTALGYITQSIALVDTPAATVSFLGALVVIICPILAVVFEKKKMGFADAPQVWISSLLCLVGVGILELAGGGEAVEAVATSAAAGAGGLFSGYDVGWGDFWSALQAVGFGTSFFFTERMMAKEPSQALSITAAQCGMSALLSAIWAVLDGVGAFNGAFSVGPHGAWLLDESVRASFTLPGMFFSDGFRACALAALFTGFITTAGNRVGETMALGKLSSSEASVLLATEPIWAAVFANLIVGEQLGYNDVVGGGLIVVACVATAIDPKWLRGKLGIEYDS